MVHPLYSRLVVEPNNGKILKNSKIDNFDPLKSRNGTFIFLFGHILKALEICFQNIYELF
jgi:hypothetical protein